MTPSRCFLPISRSFLAVLFTILPISTTSALTEGKSPAVLRREAGLLVGEGEIPFDADVGVLPGEEGHALLILALTLANRDLRFERSGEGHRADYRVSLSVMEGDRTVRSRNWVRSVEVGTFRETQLTGPTLLFQGYLTVPPGKYVLEVSVQDGSSYRRGAATGECEVAGSRLELAGPILLQPYGTFPAQAAPRPARLGALLLRPDHTYLRGEEIWVYGERHGSLAPGEEILVQVADNAGTVYAERIVPSETDGVIREKLSTDRLPPGRFALRLVRRGADGSDLNVAETPVFLTFARDWLVSGLEDLWPQLDALRLWATPPDFEAIPPGERGESWWGFWEAMTLPRQPSGQSALVTYFERIRYADQYFSEPGRGGWTSDRGRAYALLGEPAQVLRRQMGVEHRQEILTWVYRFQRFVVRLNFMEEDQQGRYFLQNPYELERALARLH